MSAEDGLALGREVALHVAQSIPQDIRPQSLGALDLKVAVPAGMTRGNMAATIAKAILRALG
jgi:hypothetical protein